ncbi:hypothetical protein AJ79_07158 [Helicocarpus griseus UAMH5409]|uniref:Uncharacterized protein n=1 Tax=Helicocarpus griseus UAMH5409 TaxID=1447875 RepID=A0A2B7X5P7_9EURO|nr:hypothetical protein AJ79_07158 [Helicocarpus griseus UAMH5409]
MPPQLRSYNSLPPVLGKKGIYGGQHGRNSFMPVCFICAITIGLTLEGGKWPQKAVDERVRISESDIAWTRNYLAIIINLEGEVFLSQIGHMIYIGPCVELLTLPVKDGTSGAIKDMEFFPLCDYPHNAAPRFTTFGYPVHAICWEFLERSLGRSLSGAQELAKLAKVLQKQMVEHKSWSTPMKLFFPREGADVFPTFDHRGVLAEEYVRWYCDPTEIQPLNKLYRICKDKRRQDCDRAIVAQLDPHGKSNDPLLLERLYAELPLEIKFLIIEHAEGTSPRSFDLPSTLPEYWRWKAFRAFGHILYDGDGCGPEELDWQLLYTRLSDEKLPDYDEPDVSRATRIKRDAWRGWQNRCRISTSSGAHDRNFCGRRILSQR